MPFQRLNEHQVVIHFARPAAVLSVQPRDALLAELSADERARHARFRFPADQDTYLVAHALVRRMLARITESTPESLEFVALEHGRPEPSEPASARDYRFSLSHTKGLVACAVTRQADVGVDVEHVARDVEILGVARHVFSPAEVASLVVLSEAEQRDRFFDLWTLKEAYIKAIGKGFSAPLREITFDPAQLDPVPVRFGPEVRDVAESWCMRRFAVGPEHRLALALRGSSSAAVHCSELDASDFG